MRRMNRRACLKGLGLKGLGVSLALPWMDSLSWPDADSMSLRMTLRFE